MNVDDLNLATADRGNTVAPLVADDAAVATAAAATADQAAIDAEALLATTAATAEKPVEDAAKPREADGKFAKKEAAADAPKVIPKDRFDEAVGKERERADAATRRADELQEQLRVKGATVDVEALIAQVRGIRREQEEAMFEGDKVKVAALADKADDLNREIGEHNATVRAQAAQQDTAIKTEAERVDATIAQLEIDHPQFKEGHELFDEELVDAVIAMQNKFIKEDRMTPSKALVKAAERMLERFGAVKAPAAEDAPAKTGLAAAAVTGDRKAAQVAKNLETALKQPGSMKELGQDSTAAGTNQVANEDVAKMNDAEFAALPEASKARMRGDFT